MRRVLTIILVAVAALAAASCGKGNHVWAGPDDTLTEALVVVATKTHAEVPLADLTSWPWDTLLIFHEGARASDVEAAVGVPVLRGEFVYDRTLMVFMQSGAPSRAVTTYMGFSFAPTEPLRFTHSARVVPVQRAGGGWDVFLLEPGVKP